MYCKILAFDYDGTLAEDNKVPAELVHALEQLHDAGYFLFLATGRCYDTLDLGHLNECFAGIIWENGAVLSQYGSDEVYLPFGHVDQQLVIALEETGVPLDHGLAIMATWSMHEETVAQVISRSGVEAVLAHNKGAIMILPPGTAKGTGLERMLELCGLSPHNVISFGDGENDLSLLQISEGSVALANSVPSLQAVADLVTQQPGPAGVLEAVQAHWLGENASPLPFKHSRQIPLGQEVGGRPVFLEAPMLIDQNIGIFGDSGTGKSWIAGLLAEGMHRAGYQVLLIDPEGDHRGLQSLPRMIAVGGNGSPMPDPAAISLLLSEASSSVVLDLCACPRSEREGYIVEILHRLHPLRHHKLRPHWIVMEEAQDFLPTASSRSSSTLLPMLSEGGWAFVSYRPERLTPDVLAQLQTCLVTRIREPEVLHALGRCTRLPPAEALATTQVGSAWLCGPQLVRLRTAGRSVGHIRHLYKYVDAPLPKHKRFFFRTDQGYLGTEAASLFEFKKLIPRLPIGSLVYHQTRGDFEKWIREALGDEILASHLEKLAHREHLKGEALRHALCQRVSARYQDLARA